MIRFGQSLEEINPYAVPDLRRRVRDLIIDQNTMNNEKLKDKQLEKVAAISTRAFYFMFMFIQ